jgi:hypothetical protein
MGGMPGHISKGTIMRKIDNTVNNLITHEPSRLSTFLGALGDPNSDYVQILLDYTSLTQAEAAYLQKYWFNNNLKDPNVFWPDKQPIEPIVRQGLIKAIQLATEDPDTRTKRNFAIDSYWICTGHDFETEITLSGQQVNRIILSPHPAFDPRHNLTAKSRIWVVKKGTGMEKPGDTGEEIIEHVHNRDQLVTVRLKEHP